ncbi:MAG: radical SAM protein [Candidatus Absconditabacterales bacterium]
MKATLIYPCNFEELKQGSNKLYEPTNLISLYNILSNHGIDTNIIDCHLPKFKQFKQITEKINKDSPNILGFSVFGRYSSINYVKTIISGIDDNIKKNAIKIIGGPGATYNTERIIKELQPNIIIKGEGEIPLKKLIEGDFNINKIKKDNINLIFETIGGVNIISSNEITDIKNIDYKRPYSLQDYNGLAMPQIQRGCIGGCTFCLGSSSKNIRYRSTENIIKEIKYLINEKKAKIILPFGPDFTANPKIASEIIKEINKSGIANKKYILVTRIDTLYTSIEHNIKERQKFIKNNEIQFQLGIESFSNEKLLRIGKKNSKFTENNKENLIKLIEQFSAFYNLFFVLFDPGSTTQEITRDVEDLIFLLEKYSSKVMLTGKLFNFMEIEPGTVISKSYDENWENFASEELKKIFSIAKNISQDLKYKSKGYNGESIYKERSLEQIEILKTFLALIKKIPIL